MRNVIHTDGHYQVELTGKGEFLVRNGSGNELGQFATNDAALQKIADDRQHWSDSVAEGNLRHAIRDNFFLANPDLEANQLAWQKWRNELYERKQRKARHLVAHERNLARQDASQYHFDRLEKDKESLAEANRVYEAAVSLDTKLKAAGFAADEDEYRAAWSEAENLMNTSAVMF